MVLPPKPVHSVPHAHHSVTLRLEVLAASVSAASWQVHVYGEPTPAVIDLCASLSVPLHRFAWTEGAKAAGLDENAVYLVRPDGYVGFAAPANDAGTLRAYARTRELRFG